MAQEKITGKQVQYLQVQRRQLGISDEVYGEMKRSVGVSSTLDLTYRQMEELLRRMNGSILRGARRTCMTCPGGKVAEPAYKPVHHSAYKSGMHRKPAEDRKEMIAKIEAILAEFKLPWSYADSIARQQSGGRIQFLRFCDAVGTRKVLQALCVYQERQGKKNMAESEIKTGDVQFYLKELRGESCQCGKNKGSGKSFCYSCWKKLPQELQRQLYKRIGEGYEEAYERAVMHLDRVEHQYPEAD